MNSRRSFLRNIALATALAVAPFLRERPPTAPDELPDEVYEVTLTKTTIHAHCQRLTTEWTMEEGVIEMYYCLPPENIEIRTSV